MFITCGFGLKLGLECSGAVQSLSFTRLYLICTFRVLIYFSLTKTLKGKASLKRQHVHGCSFVRARKFYGYHASEELFAKIQLYPKIWRIQTTIQLFIHRFGYLPQFQMAGCGRFLATLVHYFRMFILLDGKVPVNLRVMLLLREEYERTGMHDATLLFDPGKPLPEDVLKTLSHGLEFENKLIHLKRMREIRS
ncbi:hypothetical protein RHMOL_Rhmol08G0120300 [Rhododendron molle]|uniref:Uncharacterized protein n=1 Tax=Rhododendron molle TaxID=49168 RepID=A0ACC0MNL4_RHOML|nr:hypothetical protein RHMOL_Rhmol08G0120300 [Rhododendron molle]